MTSIVSLARVSTTYTNSISSANHFLCTLFVTEHHALIWSWIDYGNAIYIVYGIGLFSTNGHGLQAFLTAAATTEGTSQSSLISLCLFKTLLTTFSFTSAPNLRSAPSHETRLHVLLNVLHAGPIVPHKLLCQVVPTLISCFCSIMWCLSNVLVFPLGNVPLLCMHAGLFEYYKKTIWI